jgi:hypothetical protein|tara:strand:+ start:739 stop:948 length:210 start_codon:yes stop_codon:yes gene_type:complete
MATKETHDISLPKSTSKLSMKSKGELGTQGFDDGGAKKSYWQSFIPNSKYHVKKKIDTLYSQTQRKRDA